MSYKHNELMNLHGVLQMNSDLIGITQSTN